MSDHPKTCFLCGKDAYSAYSKKRGADQRRVCRDCFKDTCPKCGHEAFWLTSKHKPEGAWLCFSLDCDGFFPTKPTPLT